jgi:hypothetical protein
MRTTALPQESNSRDEALAAIAEAHRLIGHAIDKRVQFDELQEAKSDPRDFSYVRVAKMVEKSLSSRGMSRIFVGLLALACLGVALVSWQPSQGETEPISTSSVSKKEGSPMQPATHNAEQVAQTSVAAPESQAEGKLQPVLTSPTAAPVAPELTQQIQMIVRELANVEQGIRQIEAAQSQMVHDNAELIERLKATQQIARQNADLVDDLRVSQAQISRDNGNLAEQLKVSQEVMANIAVQLKESQEQVAHLVASEQKQRPRTLGSSPLAVANSTRRPVPMRPAPVRTQAQDPSSR